MNSFEPTADTATLESRAKLLSRLRRFFDSREFVEVQTPLLSRYAVIDLHLDPIEVSCVGESRPRFLQTSPEQNMKRLLAAGMRRIYQISSVYRDGEYGHAHNPEFTMVEWYRVGDGYNEGIELLDKMSMELIERGSAERIRFEVAFCNATELDPFESSTDHLLEYASQHKLIEAKAWNGSRDDLLDVIFSSLVQPTLGVAKPQIVTHFPLSRAALSRASVDDPRTSERFELFVDGVELANGYHELLDANELSRRDAETNQLRVAAGKSPLPENKPLLAAMRSGLPPCSGCALGFDRLAMVVLNKKRIADVLYFTWPIA